jgi:hypothetical protein
MISYMGGAKFAIDGPDFHPEAASNKIMFAGKWKGHNRKFENLPLNEND